MNKLGMKAISTIFSLCIICIIPILQSCGSNSNFLKVDDGKLSNEKAQRALNMYTNGNGSGKATVVGVQEETSSSAVSDINFQNLQYRDSDNSVTQYSGSGKASFIRYNDGRWLMTEVRFGGRYDWKATSLNVKDKKIEAR